MHSSSYAASSMRRRLILIFDFDNTIIDADSDEWIAEQFGAAPLFLSLRRQGTPWNDAVNVMLAALHAQGVTIAHIQHALCRIPLLPETIHALKAAHRLGCELRILSDANTFFINAILAHHGLSHLFSHIHTNPFWVDDAGQGCCRVGSFHHPAGSSASSTLLDAAMLPHSCHLCPPNLCKGRVIDAIMAGHGGQAMVQIMYAGDGAGDLCASLRLTSQDCILARRGYPLAEHLAQKTYLAMVKAEVRTWDSLAAVMKERLHALGMSEYNDEAAREAQEGAASHAASCAASASLNANLEPAVILKLP